MFKYEVSGAVLDGAIFVDISDKSDGWIRVLVPANHFDVVTPEVFLRWLLAAQYNKRPAASFNSKHSRV
ncbi:hypothetical protein D9758_013859 [Tetrapyrgos nigripes]|uniref:Uncharacterized protein n=1 Tax=Tetrapyrgos nigripes TaxID=182062 RepID=A0A8H5CQC1_9AGAR|nr:hypothetical protein D9758_013859 [Tetrapyrgos nigripes]